jgi:melanoma-associated antigen
LPEQKLDRYLKRVNADTYTPIDRTDRLIQRLCKDGYLTRNRDIDGGEEVTEYIVGPRGKIEVGEAGVAGLVREVYGRSDSQISNGTSNRRAVEDEEIDDFEERLERSITSSRREKPKAGDVGDLDNSGRAEDDGRTRGKGQTTQRKRRRGAAEDSIEDDDKSDG